ncbi:MAG: D-glycerate dehydrogenase [Chitinivibrionales bacterium]|nr:D-glycerate dehydrogenase [Chitinivibrionales bacterium]MBD3396092.1 D-glycerate dehydrogenase [Chitinivibrionales bacterium]
MPRPRVYVTRRIPRPGIDLLAKTCDVEVNPDDRPLSREELLDNIAGRDGVLCLLTDRMDARAFDACPGLKGLANYAVGYDNIDVAEATKRGVPISNTPDVLTDATAEMAWALLFAAARRVVESDRVMRAGAWKGWGPLQFVGGDVGGAVLGIAGAGRIGTAMALKSRGFGMKVLYFDRVRSERLEKELGARQVEFDDLLAESDYISIHCPLNEQTRHLFGREQFAKMKTSAYLINTARGPIINEAELVEALRSGAIAGAGLDVYEFEPETAGGLAALDNVVLAAHTGSATRSSRTNMALKAASNLIAMLNGDQAPDCVNPDVYRGGRV